MKWLCAFLLSISFCYSSSFSDPCTGMSLEIPDSFQFSDQDQYKEKESWWYIFNNAKGDEIVIEIEKFDQAKPLEEHIQHSTSTYEQNEQIRLEELEFKTFCIHGLDICQCSLRMFAVADTYRKPLYLCDYLFVKDQFGFTISLLKVEDEEDPEEMMQMLLHSIQFTDIL